MRYKHSVYKVFSGSVFFIILALFTLIFYIFHHYPDIDLYVSEIFFIDSYFVFSKNKLLKIIIYCIEILVAIPLFLAFISIIRTIFSSSYDKNDENRNGAVIVSWFVICSFAIIMCAVQFCKFHFERARPIDLKIFKGDNIGECYCRPFIKQINCAATKASKNNLSNNNKNTNKVDNVNIHNVSHLNGIAILQILKNKIVVCIKIIFYQGSKLYDAIFNSRYSFPSSHATYTAWLFSIVALLNSGYQIIDRSSKVARTLYQDILSASFWNIMQRYGCLAVLLLSLNIGLMRIVCGKHYLSDVVFGIFFAYFAAFIVQKCYILYMKLYVSKYIAKQLHIKATTRNQNLEYQSSDI